RRATDPEAGASLLACQCGEFGAEPLELALGPLSFERLLARIVPVDDRLPGRRALLEPALAFEQERAAVPRADGLWIELQGVPPVAERPFRVTKSGLRLAAHRDQHRVIRSHG